MLFADDLVLRDETKEMTEERLEKWRGCSEDAELKIWSDDVADLILKERLYSGDVVMKGVSSKRWSQIITFQIKLHTCGGVRGKTARFTNRPVDVRETLYRIKYTTTENFSTQFSHEKTNCWAQG